MEAKEKFEERIRAKFTTMIDWLLNDKKRGHIIDETVDVYVKPLCQRLAHHFDRLEYQIDRLEIQNKTTFKASRKRIESEDNKIEITAQVKFHDQQIGRLDEKAKQISENVRQQFIAEINKYISLRLNPLFEIIANEIKLQA